MGNPGIEMKRTDLNSNSNFLEGTNLMGTNLMGKNLMGKNPSG
jgi:hypothetical protein